MLKKTALHATKCQADSPSKKSGLIAKGKNSQQSGTTESALDNRSHRTTLHISCEHKSSSGKRSTVSCNLTMHTNQLLLSRS